LCRVIGARREVDSPSSLGTYKKCPRQYLLTYCEEGGGDRNFTSIEALMGSSVHETIEKWFKGETPVRLELSDLLAMVKASIQHKMTTMVVVSPKPERNVKWAFEQGEKCIKAWWEHKAEVLKDGSDFQSEVKFESKEPSVRGVVDLLYMIETDGVSVMVVEDYKTGSLPFKGYKNSDVERQLLLYVLMLRKQGVKCPIITRAVYLAHGKVFERCPEEDDLDRVKRWAIRTRNEITNEEEWEAKPSILCKWCEFSRGGKFSLCKERAKKQ